VRTQDIAPVFSCSKNTSNRLAMPFGNGKENILGDLLSSVLSQFKKYHSLEA